MSSITGLISGGGGGTPINGIANFAKSTNLFTDDQGQVWLNGFLTEGLASYPDAERTTGNISLMEFEAKSFSVLAQESNPLDFFFKDDGTSFYVVGSTADTVFQYNLSTAWDLSTASYSGLSFSVAAQETSPGAICFGNNGTKMYIGGPTSNVNEYNLSTAWQINTASFSGNSKSFQYDVGSIRISPDGGKIFTPHNSVLMSETKLSTPFNLSTAQRQEFIDFRTFKRSFFNNPASGTAINSLEFNSNGTMMYLKDIILDQLYQFKLMRPYDISTAIDTGQALYDELDVNNFQGMFLSPDGKHFYGLARNDDQLKEYAIPEAIGTFPSDYNQYVRIK